MQESPSNPQDNSPFDIIVAGGGIAGATAAIAAAEEGNRVLLIERYSALGGMATLGLVQPMTVWGLGNQFTIAGTGKRLLDDLHARRPEACSPVTCYGPTCDPEHLKRGLEEAVQAAGAQLLYHAWIHDADVANGQIDAVHAVTKAGTQTYSADVFIDATGDADLAHFAGVPCDVDSQGITLMFLMAGIDRDRVPENAGKLWAEHNDATYRGPAQFQHPSRPDCAFFNVTEVEDLNGLDPNDLTQATIECRKQAWGILDVARKHIPGFENAYIEQIAPVLGVRETRRIRGMYQLTGDDLLGGAEFEDAVARGCSPVDVHGDKAKGKQQYGWLKQSYGIPYRCLIAREIRNLVVVGRPISCDHVAHSSVRRMATGFAVGEAGGAAAALATSDGRDFHGLDAGRLQSLLRKRNVILDEAEDCCEEQVRSENQPMEV